jgi:hypothetical protein
VWIFRIRQVFKILRDTGSPFSHDVVVLLKRISELMVILGIASFNFTVLLTAAIVQVLALIFDYGLDLQTESDNTL